MYFSLGYLIFALTFYSTARVSAANQTLLRISTAHFEPYMYQANDGNFYNGIEHSLVQMISNELKIHLTFQVVAKRSDICNNVILNISDICVGGIFPEANLWKHTAMSLTYLSDDLTWCVRKASIIPKFLSLALIFSPEVWFGIIFGYCYVSGFVLYLLIPYDLNYTERNKRDWHYTTWLIALPATIGISPNYQPVSGTIRMFYACVLICAMIFFQLAFSRIYEFLHLDVPRHQVSTFREIVDNNLHLMGSQEAFNILSDNENEKFVKNFIVCDNMNECIEELLRDENHNSAIGGSRRNIYNSPSYSPQTIYCFDRLENIASYPIALYMQRDHHLKEKVNSIIFKLNEVGFFEKWNVDIVGRSPSKYSMRNYTPLQLKLENIMAVVLFILCTGTMMSTSTFLVENFIYSKMKLRNKWKIFIYLDQFVDGQRHYLKHSQEENYCYLP